MLNNKNNNVISRYQRFAKIALDLAAAAQYSVTYQLCSLVVSKNRVLSVGYNQPKTHPMMDTIMQQLHAECDSMFRCPKDDLVGADIVVARVKGSGKPGLAKPCDYCVKMMKRFGVKKVFYTVNNDSLQLGEMRL